MSLREVVVDVLLWAGVALELLSCIGLLAMHSVYDRLHFSGPAALGVVLVAGAVVVEESFSLIGNKAILIAALVLIASPLSTHALGRAARVIERGDWRLGPNDDVDVEEP